MAFTGWLRISCTGLEIDFFKQTDKISLHGGGVGHVGEQEGSAGVFMSVVPEGGCPSTGVNKRQA